MREIKTRSGSGLTEFWPNLYVEWDEEESSMVIQELWDCPLLEHLDVTGLVINHAFWDFALRLQHLRSLTIDIESVVGILQAPQGVKKADNLKELELRLNHFDVDWKSISKWAGDKLVKLVLLLESESMKGLISSTFNSSIIINSKQHLKELHLSNGGREEIDPTQAVWQEKLSETKFISRILRSFTSKTWKHLSFASSQMLNTQSFEILPFVKLMSSSQDKASTAS